MVFTDTIQQDLAEESVQCNQYISIKLLHIFYKFLVLLLYTAGSMSQKSRLLMNEKRKVLNTMRQYMRAGLTEGESERACAYLTPRAQRYAARTIPNKTSCTAAHDFLARTLSADGELLQMVESALDTIENNDKMLDRSVEIEGDTAIVHGGNKPQILRRSGGARGRWRVASNPLTYKETTTTHTSSSRIKVGSSKPSSRRRPHSVSKSGRRRSGTRSYQH